MCSRVLDVLCIFCLHKRATGCKNSIFPCTRVKRLLASCVVRSRCLSFCCFAISSASVMFFRPHTRLEEVVIKSQGKRNESNPFIRLLDDATVHAAAFLTLADLARFAATSTRFRKLLSLKIPEEFSTTLTTRGFSAIGSLHLHGTERLSLLSLTTTLSSLTLTSSTNNLVDVLASLRSFSPASDPIAVVALRCCDRH